MPRAEGTHSCNFPLPAPEELETQAHTEQKFKRHSVDMGQLYTTKGGPVDAVATVTTETPGAQKKGCFPCYTACCVAFKAYPASHAHPLVVYVTMQPWVRVRAA
jgi:hypothetical protein